MSRKRARENRRIKAWETRQGIREEMIGSRNRYGIKDPTPYEAVLDFETVRHDGRNVEVKYDGTWHFRLI